MFADFHNMGYGTAEENYHCVWWQDSMKTTMYYRSLEVFYFGKQQWDVQRKKLTEIKLN